jgi:hypothetical protein
VVKSWPVIDKKISQALNVKRVTLGSFLKAY